MLQAVGAASLDQLIDETVPPAIRLEQPLDLPPPRTESQYLHDLETIAACNQVARSYIGLGYYECTTPSVILRNVLENPGWYTPYTPYQAEIAQGRLEGLLNFQTMVTDLTGLEVANASLLDESTAAAEAMSMIHRIVNRKIKKAPRNRFLVSSGCNPQTVEVLQNRAEPVDIEIVVEDPACFHWEPEVFGALIQTPDAEGRVLELSSLVDAAHEAGALVGVATDLLAAALIKPPGEWGADVAIGNSQRFGVPMGYGGPHAAFFATREAYVREMPGRIIGITRDAHGLPAYRMALQTREQHIRREKARSNICTAQALLANIAGFYAVYHGPAGIRAIADRLHGFGCILSRELRRNGFDVRHSEFFDTLFVPVPESDIRKRIRSGAESAGVNLRYTDSGIGIALGEPVQVEDLREIVGLMAGGRDGPGREPAFSTDLAGLSSGLPASLRRESEILSQSVFSAHPSETEMMRYLRHLESKDIGLDCSMIPLGSCTMKLNAATEMIPVTWPAFSRLHPFAPAAQAAGYRQVFDELEEALCEITGFHAVSLQPNSGAQGEYAGLMVIRAYHRARGEKDRNVVLIPSSAHGTNPASAVMAGLKVVVVGCDDQGNINLDDLAEKALLHSPSLSALMVTYPSTHGVFEERICEVCALIHEQGGQVYMDGANMNAQVGLTSPASIGADVCHLNLHKTFSIPHGGGGPGMGPIAVAEHLAPFLPGHAVVGLGGASSMPALAAAPWGSASILLISYAYIRMLGAEGMTDASRVAILNANYVKARLENHFDVLFTGRHGRVAHELIFDLRPFKTAAGITEIDVAKRLMDYGFHAPTVSWPIAGTLMIEPTESESKEELDRFCDALVSIRGEIRAIEDGKSDREDNVLRCSPHCATEIASTDWSHAYSREAAAYPLPYLRVQKTWPAVGRIDDLHGDRNLVCTCPTLKDYLDAGEPTRDRAAQAPR